MSHSVQLHFDPRSSRTIRELRKSLYDSLQLSDAGEPRTKPHLSLGVYENSPKALTCESLGEFAKQTKPFSLVLSSVGIFPGADGDIVYLGPVATVELLELHATFHHVFEDAVKYCSEHYLPGKWVPHVTLAIGAPKHKTPLAVSFLQGQKLPLRVRVKDVSLIEFPPVKTECTFQLKKSAK